MGYKSQGRNVQTSGTFAGKPSAPYAGQEYFATNIGGGIMLVYTGTKWKPINGVATLYNDVTYTSVTATSAEQNIKNYSIPAGLLSTTGGIEIIGLAAHTGTAGAKNYVWRHTTATGSTSGGSLILNSSVGSAGSTLSQIGYHSLFNAGTLASQKYMPNGTSGWGSSSTVAFGTGAIDTAAESWVNLNLQGTASDTMGYSVVTIRWIEE